MLKKYSLFYLSGLCAAVLASCSPKVVTTTAPAPAPQVVVGATTPAAPVSPFAVTNLFYNTKTDSLLSIARQQLPAIVCDSNGVEAFPSEWVGTVNFGMRKANYVILH